ncbi:TerB family tellurite resistance protein [Paracoccaceae bacterium]|jgi:uncharacterized tellurite resistance protein B-like protein|nr:TerB family tellurite resistance protein [Paracoccaceae bacterium]
MFANLLKTLLGPEPKDLTPSDARLAIAALLVRVARSDNDYAAAEIEKIDRMLATRYELNAAQSVDLRKQGEELEKEAPDTVRFTRAIKDSVPYVDRVSVIEALWQIALADGERDIEEDALLRLVANLLGISDVESASVRKRIAAS